MKKTFSGSGHANDFVDGSLGTEEAQDIVSSVVEKVQDAREEETDIIFTRDTHQADYFADSGREKASGRTLYTGYTWMGDY